MNKQETEIFNEISELAMDQFSEGNYRYYIPDKYSEVFCFAMARINYEDRISDLMADYGNEITSLFFDYRLAENERIGESYVKFYERYTDLIVKCYAPVVNKIYNDQMSMLLDESRIMQDDELDYLQRGD